MQQPGSYEEGQAWESLPVVTRSGEVDLAVAPELKEDLAALLDAGHRSIVVDLLEATFLDSTALGVLVVAREQCLAGGGQLHLLVTDPRVRRVLEITGLDGAFPLHDARVLR